MYKTDVLTQRSRQNWTLLFTRYLTTCTNRLGCALLTYLLLYTTRLSRRYSSDLLTERSRQNLTLLIHTLFNYLHNEIVTNVHSLHTCLPVCIQRSRHECTKLTYLHNEAVKTGHHRAYSQII